MQGEESQKQIARKDYLNLYRETAEAEQKKQQAEFTEKAEA